MQGYKGAAAPHHNRRSHLQVVVRAVVDHASQRAALLLDDSSCLLVSLAAQGGRGSRNSSSSSSSVLSPITVPAPCTDACFLRLHAYGGAGAAGKVVGATGSTVARLGFGSVEIGQGESPTFRAGEVRENGAAGKGGGGGGGNGKGRGGGGVRRELCVVTARPGKGGASTELRAWSCGDRAFGGAEIELEPGDGRVRASGGRVVARLDAPHGLAVKMAASINVLVVYSSSAGKFWVMAGKWSDQSGGPAQNVRHENVFGAEEYERKRLILMKRAVVSCYGPVYSIHVSSLHLFLGESKGVRVWSLRPLIKPGSSGKSSGQSKPRLQGTSEQGSHQSAKKFDCESCGRGERCQHIVDSSSALGKVDEMKSADNGVPSEENGDVRVSLGGISMKKVPRKGLHTAREPNLGASVAGLGNYRNTKLPGSGSSSRFSNFEFRSLSELQAVLKTDLSPEILPAEEEFEEKTTIENGGGGLIKNETHNGILRSYPAEHGEISVKETLIGPKLRGHTEGDSATSNPEVSRLHEYNGDFPIKTPPRPRNGLTPVAESLLEAQIVASNLVKKKVLHQSAEPALVTGSRVQSRKSKELDSAGVWFVALSGEEEVITAQSSSQADRRPYSQLQVVDIQGLGLKEYIVLDSKGELHLLTLHEVSEEQKSEFPGRTHLTIRRLRSTMRVTSFTVLPLPPPLPQAHQDFVSPAAVIVKRKLWISDGTYSIHVVIVPEEKIKVIMDSSSTEATLPVSQALFMKDLVDGLLAGSPDTVVVLMKGRLVSYSIPGD